MPSASAKIEKVASSEAADPVKAIVNMLEKRIRNLEKRKVKLDNYRTDVTNGKELNEDQKIAVSKYDQVEALLEFTRDFSKAMNSIVLESARHQKKMAKRELLEKQQHEIQRLQNAFIYRHILSCFDNEDVRNDFLSGENGAVKLTNEELAQLDQLYKLVEPGLPAEQADITNHFHVLSENLIFLVEGKNKEIAGTTYKVLKELLQGIKESGYFSRPSTVMEEEVTSSDDAPEDLPEKSGTVEEVETSDETAEIAASLENEQSETEIVEEETPTALSPIPVETLQPVGQLTLQNGPLQEVLSSQGSFNFLQESQIDLDAPHMDPAVVAVHQIAPPPTANFPVSTYPVASPTTAEEKPTVNGNETCEPVISPRNTATLSASANLDFDPSHPIPTQTFTNQSFAVMQNMMLPQAYVPVTMHHGPIPPHMAPIAVVPGLSAPVSSAGPPVMPIHMSVAPIMLGPVVADTETAVAAVEATDGEDNQHTEMEAENGSSAAQSSNVSNERFGNGEGYTPHPFRGGFRGRGPRRSSGGYFRRSSYNNNGRGGFQNNYYQDRNGFNPNFRRGNNRGAGLRGNGNFRGRSGSNNYRNNASQQQQQPAPQQQQQQQQQQQPPQQEATQ